VREANHDNSLVEIEIARERLVDLVGFEPTTSSMPWKRAPNCATGPRRATADAASTVGSNHFILPRLLTIVKPVPSTDFENMWIMGMLNTKFLTSKMTLNLIRTLLFALLVSAACLNAQITPAPVPYTSVSELNAILGPLEQASQATQADLTKLRIDKWKMDSSYKKQVLGNTDSVKRNLGNALPEIMTQLRNSPEDLSATFKLYRNLDALYDVLGNITESAGAFGSKDEFQALSNDLNAIERNRRSLAERLETLTASKESELAQLRNQLKTLQAAPPPPPKKIVVDDNEPKKPAPKKKIPRPPKPATPPAQSATPPPS
jgi:hypothetical protein